MAIGAPRWLICQWGSPGREFSLTGRFPGGRCAAPLAWLAEDAFWAEVVQPATAPAAPAAVRPRNNRREQEPGTVMPPIMALARRGRWRCGRRRPVLPFS